MPGWRFRLLISSFCGLDDLDDSLLEIHVYGSLRLEKFRVAFSPFALFLF